ncbi:MAG TPA: hypothetical protein ENH70_09325 [Desulfobacteraceae bacterium]|nr:hypothetical protein [Desulfobacteraceae bacterium]
MARKVSPIEPLERNQASWPQPSDHGDYYQEEEVNLVDYLIVLLRHKLLIIGMVLIAGIGAVFMTLGRERVYRSEATIAPRSKETIKFYNTCSREKIVTELNSRKLAAMVIERYDLMPVLFPEAWDSDKNKWKADISPPTLQDGIKALQGMLDVDVPRKAKEIIKLSFVNRDPQAAKRFVDYYLTTLSESMREEVLRDTTENRRFLEKQLSKARDPLTVEKIYALLAAEIEKDTFARGQKYFGFKILDPPVAPDLDKGEPRHRTRDCLLAVVVAFFLAVFMAFMIEYVRRFQTDDEERYRELVRELKVWRIRRR